MFIFLKDKKENLFLYLIDIWCKTQLEVEIRSGCLSLGSYLDVRVDHNKSTGTKRGTVSGPGVRNVVSYGLSLRARKYTVERLKVDSSRVARVSSPR